MIGKHVKFVGYKRDGQQIREYLGRVDLSDQMKISYKVDRRSKFRFYLRNFFDFLNISVVNSKI